MMLERLRQVNFIELAVFGAVGVSATLVHYIGAIAAIEWLGMAVWLGNIVGFLLAFPVSYLGHALLTFSARHYGREKRVTGQSASRFFILAVSGFSINQACVLVLTYAFEIPPRIGILATLIAVAGLLYLLSKFWAYKGSAPAKG